MERKPLMGYYATHRALRKDTERLKTVSSKFDQYTSRDWKKLAAWFSYHAKLVYFHHHGEDEFFFPWIRQRSAKFPAQLQQMDDEHKALDKFMERMQRAFSSLVGGHGVSKDEFALTVTSYSKLLVTHLDGEEKLVEEALKEFKLEEIFAAEAQYLALMSQQQKTMSLPWMVEVMDPDERQVFFSMAPFFVKWIYRLIAKPKYEKMVSVI